MHVLDTRSYRDDQLCSKVDQKNCRATDSAEATILGTEQEAWLSRGLSNDARWNLLAQQVFVMPLGTKKPDSVIVRNSLDKWDGYPAARGRLKRWRSEEHTSELQSLMRISYAVFCLKKKNHRQKKKTTTHRVARSYK